MVEKDIAVPKERLHRKKSETVETDSEGCRADEERNTGKNQYDDYVYIVFKHLEKS